MSACGRGGGRGAYYKAKYGGRGRGRGNPADDDSTPSVSSQQGSSSSPRSWNRLSQDLTSIDGSQYGAYKALLGSYLHTSPKFTLFVEHVQNDAYASPSKVRVVMDWQEAGFPNDLTTSDVRIAALSDYLSRVAAQFIRDRHMDESLSGSGGGWSGPKGGVFHINAPGQEILPRTSAMVTSSKTAFKKIELRFTVSLPASGRTVLGRQAYSILGVNLVDLVKTTLVASSLSKDHLIAHINSAEDQQFMRNQLTEKGLIAFVANGSILPRTSGASSLPLTGTKVVLFRSPPQLEVVLRRLHGAEVPGMGIPAGVTLLTGGGYHGKSTLLEALELGVYNHIPGDGRELIVTDPTAVKIRAEDGRSVAGTNISPFIKNLPGGKDTSSFSTDDASGSTSMAASIQEALEAGCQTLLVDEDSSATNLLVRDERMQRLVRREPITPFISKVRCLYEQHGVSTIIVIGGLGDWLSVADKVIGMDCYIPADLTDDAQAIVKELPKEVAQDSTFGTLPQRSVGYPVSLFSDRPPYAKTKNFITTSAGQSITRDPAEAEPGIDLSGLDQLIETGQSRMIAHYVRSLAVQTNSRADLMTALTKIETHMNTIKCMPDALQGGDFVAVRKMELAAAISRIRGLTVQTDSPNNGGNKGSPYVSQDQKKRRIDD